MQGERNNFTIAFIYSYPQLMGRYEQIHGISVRPFPGLVNFVPAVAHLFCLNLPAAFSQPWSSLIEIPCSWMTAINGRVSKALVLVKMRELSSWNLQGHCFKWQVWHITTLVAMKMAIRWHPNQICTNWQPGNTHVNFSQIGHQMAIWSNLPKLPTRLHLDQICQNWLPEGTLFIFVQTDHKMAPWSNSRILATRWHPGQMKLATRWYPDQIWPNIPPFPWYHQMAHWSNLLKLTTRWHPDQSCHNWPPAHFGDKAGKRRNAQFMRPPYPYRWFAKTGQIFPRGHRGGRSYRHRWIGRMQNQVM